MNEPLPLPSRTAIAFASGENAAAMYDGGFERDGERAEPCLGRCFPDFAALCADDSFEALAAQIYKPMLDWIAAGVEVVPREADASMQGEEPAHV
jgi:exodeoxyribonuclease V gamma subunit